MITQLGLHIVKLVCVDLVAGMPSGMFGKSLLRSAARLLKLRLGRNLGLYLRITVKRRVRGYYKSSYGLL